MALSKATAAAITKATTINKQEKKNCVFGEMEIEMILIYFRHYKYSTACNYFFCIKSYRWHMCVSHFSLFKYEDS